MLWNQRIQDRKIGSNDAKEYVDNGPGNKVWVIPILVFASDCALLDDLPHDAADARDSTNSEQETKSDFLSDRDSLHLVENDDWNGQQSKVQSTMDYGQAIA